MNAWYLRRPAATRLAGDGGVFSLAILDYLGQRLRFCTANDGGVAPSTPGQAVGEEANVYYTAEYFFYRAH